MNDRRPLAAERLSLAGPAGVLESVVEDPGTPSTRYAVVCHPHPLFGGTMENKVVTTLARALHQLAIPTVRFNFRGVGASQGAFDQGKGESADADSVAAWGQARWPDRGLIVAGFSFGAYVAMRLAAIRQASFLVCIAPPVQRFEFPATIAVDRSWLVVQGDSDDIVNPQSVFDWVAGFDPPPRLVVMPGAGHFFHGRLDELRRAVRDAVSAAIRNG